MSCELLTALCASPIPLGLPKAGRPSSDNAPQVALCGTLLNLFAISCEPSALSYFISAYLVFLASFSFPEDLALYIIVELSYCY